METTRGAKNVAKHNPITIAVDGVVLVNRDAATDSVHSRSGIPPCPAYHTCRKLRESRHVSPMSNDDHAQQVTVLRDLLQPIKENALKLRQLIADNANEERQRSSDSQTRDRGTERSEGSGQQRDPGSGLIIATTSISVCALCGVALHLTNPSEESRQFASDENERTDRCNYDRDIAPENLDGALSRGAPRKDIPFGMKESSDHLSIRENIASCLSLEEISNIDVLARKGSITKISSINVIELIRAKLRSKLLFKRRISSHKSICEICQRRCNNNEDQMMGHDDGNCCKPNVASKHSRRHDPNGTSKMIKLKQPTPRTPHVSPAISHVDASTLTREMFCPCACGLLVSDGIESEISIESLPMPKEKPVKIKLEELGILRDSKEMTIKANDKIQKIRKMKIQEPKKDKSIEFWVKEEIARLQLQAQAEELHKNILFFKEENEYLRQVVAKYRCSSERTRLLLLPIRTTYSGLTIAIEFLRTKYRGKNGITATIDRLIDIFRSSINVQRITEKLLAPFVQHWYRNLDSTVRSAVCAIHFEDESSFEVVESHSTYTIR